MESVKINDILTYRSLSGIRYSTDGKRAAFVVSNANEEENSYESRLWLYENGSLKKLTDLGKERTFTWLDDTHIIFPAARSDAEKKRAEAGEEFTSYYVLDINGGEASCLFTVPFVSEDVKVLGGGRFALIASADKKYPELWKGDREYTETAVKERKENKDYEVLDELPCTSNGQGFISGKRRMLFLAEAEPYSLSPVTEISENVSGITVLGDEVFYSVEKAAPKRSIRGFEVRAVNFKTGEKRVILKNESHLLGGLEAAGETLFLFASEGKRYGLNENSWVYTVDARTGEMKLLRREEYSMYNSVGSDVRYGGGRNFVPADGKLYHLTTREGNSYLYCLGPDGKDEPVLEAEGSAECFDISGDTVLLSGLYGMLPQELYTYDLKTKALYKISSFNEKATEGRYIAKPEPLTVRSGELEIGGWVLLPKDYDPEKRYPAVFDIHGGPKTVYGPVFYHEMQVWAGKGYFVFFCNPKGSDGRDNEFSDIFGDYGGTDYRNLMDFTDAVLEKYPQIDKKRVCETGGSYGGFMTNWIIGHTDRFCCAASQRSISNWLSFCGTSDIGVWFAPDQTRGDLYTDPGKLWEQSPLKYAGNVKTPTLFIHSDEDWRCPLEQGLQMYAALLDRGVEARMCLFHGENHELSRSGKPKHRIRRLEEITSWFDRFSS